MRKNLARVRGCEKTKTCKNSWVNKKDHDVFVEYIVSNYRRQKRDFEDNCHRTLIVIEMMDMAMRTKKIMRTRMKKMMTMRNLIELGDSVDLIRTCNSIIFI